MSTDSRWRAAGRTLRHSLVGRLPDGARAAVTRWSPPWVDRFTVPLPGGEELRLAFPRAHRMLTRLYWEGPASYEPVTARTWWCLSQQSHVVADIGAFAGYYALLACKAAPPATSIDAFEPLAEAGHMLGLLARLNRCVDAIRVHQVALGSTVGPAVLSLPAMPANAVPTVGSTVDPPPGPTRQRRVEMTTLDAALAPRQRRADLVKLDVEGAELEVLRGAQQTIEGSHPDIIMEVVPDGARSAEALSWLIDRGYRVFDLTATGPVGLEVRALAGMRNQRDAAGRRYGEVLASTRSSRELATLGRRMASLQWPA